MEQNPPIRITQAEMKEAWALYTHLRNVFHLAVTESFEPTRPMDVSHYHALLAASSLRTLLLDNNPLLIRFLDRHKIDAPIFCLESDLSLFFLSVISKNNWHVSDIFAKASLKPDSKVQDEDGPTFREWQSFAYFATAEGEKEIDGYKKMFETVGKYAPFGSMNDGRKGTTYVAPTQIVDITGHSIDARNLLTIKMGNLGDIPIRRKNIVQHVANVLGGVHYDTLRLPKDEGSDDYKAALRLYDWNDQCIANGALVAINVIAIELVSSPAIFGIMEALERLLATRQSRLERGEELPEDKEESPDAAA